MLKGTMTIEMTDVQTGKTEKVLEQNMVTNALTEIFKPLGLAKDPSIMLNSFAPYYQTLLGGILLFDKNIEENPNNLYPPADASLYIRLQTPPSWDVQFTVHRITPKAPSVGAITRQRVN